jgi:hypothetical protein
MNKAKYLNDVVIYTEAENIIENLQLIRIEEFGSEKFMKKHSVLEKLNMQSLKHALEGGDDYILTFFCDYDKVKDLIEELLHSFFYRIEVYPKIKKHVAEKSSLKAYIILYHEAILINLLENFFFHATACINAQDYLIDIIDYCHYNLRELYNRLDKESRSKPSNPQLPQESLSAKELYNKMINQSNEEELDSRLKEIEIQVNMACISILRYITDHLNQLAFPIRHHLTNVKDILILLVPLLEYKPWVRINTKGKEEVYESNHWVEKNSSVKLNKIEAQVNLYLKH